MHLQWFRHLCQHKAWTLCLGLADRKRFPMLQQFIPKVGKYYNLRDKVIKSSRKGMVGKNDMWDITSVWPECTFICHTPTSRGGTASSTMWEQLLDGLQQLEPLQNLHKHNTLSLGTVWGQNLWELWFRTLYRPFQQPVKMQFLNWSGRF